MHRRLVTHLIKVYRVRARVQFITSGRVHGQTQPSSYILYLETRTTSVVMRESFKNCILYGAMCIIKRRQPSLCLEGVFCGGDFDWGGNNEKRTNCQCWTSTVRARRVLCVCLWTGWGRSEVLSDLLYATIMYDHILFIHPLDDSSRM